MRCATFVLLILVCAGAACAEKFDTEKFVRACVVYDSTHTATFWTCRSKRFTRKFTDPSQTKQKTCVITDNFHKRFRYDSLKTEVLSKRVEGAPDDDKQPAGKPPKNMLGKQPFNPNFWSHYVFSDGGQVVFEGILARRINFRAKIRDDEHFDGYALFDEGNLHFLRVYFTLAKPPSVLDFFETSTDYIYESGYRVPKCSHAKLYGRALLVISFSVSVEESFSDYKFP